MCINRDATITQASQGSFLKPRWRVLRLRWSLKSLHDPTNSKSGPPVVTSWLSKESIKETEWGSPVKNYHTARRPEECLWVLRLSLLEKRLFFRTHRRSYGLLRWEYLWIDCSRLTSLNVNPVRTILLSESLRVPSRKSWKEGTCLFTKPLFRGRVSALRS